MTTKIDTIDMDGIFHDLALYPVSIEEKKQALKRVLSYSMYDGLTLYFGGGYKLYGDVTFDIGKAIKESSVRQPSTTIEWLIENESFAPNPEEHKEITTLDIEPIFNKRNELRVNIIDFKYKDELCSFVDEKRNYIGSFNYPYDQVYCFRQELFDLILKLKKPIYDNNPPAKIKKLSKPERQVEAFKKWLEKESKLKFSQDESYYQECYRKIGQPTREETWKRLVKYAPKLFTNKLEHSIKQQNFFNRSKGGQKIVLFEGNER